MKECRGCGVGSAVLVAALLGEEVRADLKERGDVFVLDEGGNEGLIERKSRVCGLEKDVTAGGGHGEVERRGQAEVGEEERKELRYWV